MNPVEADFETHFMGNVLRKWIPDDPAREVRAA